MHNSRRIYGRFTSVFTLSLLDTYLSFDTVKKWNSVHKQVNTVPTFSLFTQKELSFYFTLTQTQGSVNRF